MNRLTASPTGDYTALSIRIRKDSDNKIQLQLNYEEEPTEIKYTIDQCPHIVKTIGNGIVKDVDSSLLSYTITLLSSDNIKHGYHDHYIEITNSNGTFKASLDKGRVRVEK